ncbi:MAG TPA: Crp/Fnr family transcriptional regulator [Pyrinomonadaceae bacterium]|jgi:CRP-like cAMP-binding protein|nr:Crp/Fnr family transcriptional regulator [Pyrinomonadaceae bacterium]
MRTRNRQDGFLNRSAPSAPPVNRLLATLPKNEYKRLLPKLKTVNLVLGELLYESGDAIKDVYFPNDSIISLISEVSERSWLEVGMVGNEGMAGLPVFMGVSSSSIRALVQGSGTAMRMSSAAVRMEANRVGSLHRLLHRYSHSLLTQVSQSAACNRFHLVEARLARWLLMTNDRLGAEAFPLTQEFLSHMLGVRREGVSKAAGALQAGKLIRYSRGVITILNRRGLEAKSCQCYAIIKAETDTYLN